MKIKVVDMPYEQALAQPREKHTLPRRPSMLFRALLRALSAPDLRATHFRCDRVGISTTLIFMADLLQGDLCFLNRIP